MARLTFKINGVDYSFAAQKYGIGVTYEKREGKFGAMMLDGTMMSDVIDHKSVLTVPLNTMKSAEQSALLRAVLAKYVTVEYFEPRYDGIRTAQFIPDVGTTRAAIINSNGEKWYEGLALTLTER